MKKTRSTETQIVKAIPATWEWPGCQRHLPWATNNYGMKSANYLKSLNEKYKDESGLYKNYKDLNDCDKSYWKEW